VDPVPDPLLLRKSGSAGNRTRDFWVSSQELWPLDHKGGPPLGRSMLKYNHCSISIFRSVRRLLVRASVVPSSQIVTLMKGVLSSSERSVIKRATRRTIPEEFFIFTAVKTSNLTNIVRIVSGEIWTKIQCPLVLQWQTGDTDKVYDRQQKWVTLAESAGGWALLLIRSFLNKDVINRDFTDSTDVLTGNKEKRFEVLTSGTMKNAVFWDIKTKFVLHRRHITSPLKSPAS
jgi:hypothetical protein